MTVARNLMTHSNAQDRDFSPAAKKVTHRTFSTLSTTMVAERGSPFTIIVETLTSKAITWNVETSDSVDNIKSKVQVKEGTLLAQRLICSGKQLEDEITIADHNITYGSTLYVGGRLEGGAAMSAEEDHERSQYDVPTASASGGQRSQQSRCPLLTSASA